MRREATEVARHALTTEAAGERRRGKPKIRHMLTQDLLFTRLDREEAPDLRRHTTNLKQTLAGATQR